MWQNASFNADGSEFFSYFAAWASRSFRDSVNWSLLSSALATRSRSIDSSIASRYGENVRIWSISSRMTLSLSPEMIAHVRNFSDHKCHDNLNLDSNRTGSISLASPKFEFLWSENSYPDRRNSEIHPAADIETWPYSNPWNIRPTWYEVGQPPLWYKHRWEDYER